ncbi:MAG: STAS domain-containing protein [Phycisphaerales bacterium]|jgi:anti-anti-sigma factor|nr:STAS domain-containing protein [Phycisphaerales bacterium]|tara:strand:+ start:973 stop:1314 length:342 start_codon:yes stop_codon:yes gene_type:complete
MMTFEQQSIGAVSVLRPIGPIANTEDSEQFVDQASQLIRKSLGRFVLDASELSYVDSTGLESLVDIANQLNGFGQALKICAMGETLSETIRVTHTTESFEPFTQVQDAVRSYR